MPRLGQTGHIWRSPVLLRRVAIQNVRSFLERTELETEGKLSILIGPNGGGKTNLLDTTVTAIRKYLLSDNGGATTQHQKTRIATFFSTTTISTISSFLDTRKLLSWIRS